MENGQEYSTETARAAAARDELGDWVTRFLASPGSDNAALGELLAEKPLVWIGPIELPLDQLNRLAGPPGAPVLEEVHDHEWRDDVDDLARRIEGGHEPAPVIVTKKGEQLVLEDGNHRVEALRRAGVERAWSIVGFDDQDDLDRFVARSEAATT